MSESLAETVAERVLESVIDGSIPAGSLLPPEGELAATHGVSRLTIREAIRILRTQNVVQIRRGRGTEVNPREQWTSLEAIIRASAGSTQGSASASERLLEARRMIEIGAVQLAAARRADEDLTALQEQLDAMTAACESGDITAFVDADILFHDVIMEASGNIFVPLLFGTLGPLLVEARRQTSSIPTIQRNAITRHSEIVDALRSGNPETARIAMERHMDQTENDLRRYVVKGEA